MWCHEKETFYFWKYFACWDLWISSRFIFLAAYFYSIVMTRIILYEKNIDSTRLFICLCDDFAYPLLVKEFRFLPYLSLASRCVAFFNFRTKIRRYRISSHIIYKKTGGKSRVLFSAQEMDIYCSKGKFDVYFEYCSSRTCYKHRLSCM